MLGIVRCEERSEAEERAYGWTNVLVHTPATRTTMVVSAGGGSALCSDLSVRDRAHLVVLACEDGLVLRLWP